MCRQSQRFGQCDQLAHRHLPAGKLKTFGIFRQPAHLYGAFPRADEDHVSVRKLNLGHFATKQEIIEIELGANGAAALYLNVEEGAPIRIDAAGLINIVQDTVHAGAGVGPRPVDKTANKNPDGLSGRQTGIRKYIRPEYAANCAVHDLLQLLVPNPKKMDGTKDERSVGKECGSKCKSGGLRTK